MLPLLVLAALQVAAGPVVSVVEPNTFEPYRPVELTVRGSGFEQGCRVLLGVPGRMVPVRHEVTSDSEIRVRLAAGYGPTPAERQLVVDCGSRRRTNPVAIRIVTASEESEEVAERPPPAVTTPEIDPPPGSDPPVVTRLDPTSVSAGLPFTLTVMGERFEEGAEVEVFANVHAGSSRQPEYRMVGFPAEFASDTVLLVDFDRGFAPSPRLRQVVVVNPGGATSAPLYFEIQRRSP